ncbi:MAG: SapC family protein [Betaproteobacteria bacterium]|nr:SapC family protein [Betaproteobacteria bacterium]
MQIAPPYGYTEVVPFLKTSRVRLLAPGEAPPFVRQSNAIPVSYTEFQLVAREYPIVFTTGDEGRNFAAVAVLGITAAENLFYDGRAWASDAYVPAYARRYPFCMARVTVDRQEHKDRLICVEKSHLDEEAGESMFDGEGRPATKWTEIERLLAEYEADLERSREMCAILGDYGLLEPFSMQATLAKEKGAGPMHLTGMHRVSERNLENLNAAQLKNLLRKGILARIYLHLLSLENFARLLDRKAAQRAPERETLGKESGGAKSEPVQPKSEKPSRRGR